MTDNKKRQGVVPGDSKVSFGEDNRHSPDKKSRRKLIPSPEILTSENIDYKTIKEMAGDFKLSESRFKLHGFKGLEGSLNELNPHTQELWPFILHAQQTREQDYKLSIEIIPAVVKKILEHKYGPLLEKTGIYDAVKIDAANQDHERMAEDLSIYFDELKDIRKLQSAELIYNKGDPFTPLLQLRQEEKLMLYQMLKENAHEIIEKRTTEPTKETYYPLKIQHFLAYAQRHDMVDKVGELMKKYKGKE